MPLDKNDMCRSVALLSCQHKRLGEKSPLRQLEPGIVAQIMKMALSPVVERPIFMGCNIRTFDEDFYDKHELEVEGYAPLHFLCTIKKDGIPVFRKPLDSATSKPGAFISFTYNSVRIPEYGRVKFNILIDVMLDSHKAKIYHAVRESRVDECGQAHTLKYIAYPDDSITTFQAVNDRGIEVEITIPETFDGLVCTPTWGEDTPSWF